mmetsp:Transcript_9171/g.20259  ORF Transcript_9171/g.20259 Transcript_9171/m.20259 type:complete len:215 (+) Transcript_9171:248-892(+)
MLATLAGLQRLKACILPCSGSGVLHRHPAPADRGRLRRAAGELRPIPNNAAISAGVEAKVTGNLGESLPKDAEEGHRASSCMTRSRACSSSSPQSFGRAAAVLAVREQTSASGVRSLSCTKVFTLFTLSISGEFTPGSAEHKLSTKQSPKAASYFSSRIRGKGDEGSLPPSKMFGVAQPSVTSPHSRTQIPSVSSWSSEMPSGRLSTESRRDPS